MLEWTPPRDSGGREDLVYNIICKSCGSGRGACTRCGDNVQYAPRQLGLTEPRIYISDLLAHTQYTFEIQAVNGVTDQSPFSPQFASVNITTNQAGKHFKGGLLRPRRTMLCQMGILAALVKDALASAEWFPLFKGHLCDLTAWECYLSMVVVFIIIAVTCGICVIEGKSESPITKRPGVGRLEEHRNAFLSHAGGQGRAVRVSSSDPRGEIRGHGLLPTCCLTSLHAPGLRGRSSVAGMSVLQPARGVRERRPRE